MPGKTKTNDTTRIDWIEENQPTIEYSARHECWEVITDTGVWERATMREAIDAAAADARPYSQ